MLRLIAEKKIAFARINGSSPCNVRADANAIEDDFASLAATIDALGQIKPLAVHGDDASGYWIIDGLRRWNAQAARVQQHRLDPDAEDIPVRVYEGEPAELEELSLAASLQKQLHPVEEFEAFDRLANAGIAEEAIARDFGLTLRHVKQRLALGRMAAPIRAAWRTGKINREAAEAYCELGDAAAQEELFAELSRTSSQNGAYVIRARARKDKVSAADPMARYVGLDAYAKAGGVIRETLFDTEEEKLLSDGALLRRLAREKLRDDAETIRAEEGWGFVVIEGDPDAPQVARVKSHYDYTDAECDRIEEIERICDDLDATCDEFVALVREAIGIERRAALRTYTKADRKRLGIEVEIADNGEMKVTRAVEKLPKTAPEPAPDSPRGPAPQSDAYEPKPLERAKVEVEAPPTKGAGEVVNAAATETLAGLASTSGNFALTLLVARLGCCYGGREGGLCISGHESAHYFREPTNALLKSIKRESFGAALNMVAAAPFGDVTAAAFELIGAHINPRPEDINHTLHTLRVAAEFGEVRTRLREAMDYEAYFKACPREAAFELFEEFLGASDVAAAKKLKKAPIVEKAAQLAKDKGWLPPQFSNLPEQVYGLPEEVSETADPVDATGEQEPESLNSMVARFIDLFIDRDANACEVDGGEMDNVFYAFNQNQGGEIFNGYNVRKALAAAGLNYQNRGMDGVYVGCALKNCSVAASSALAPAPAPAAKPTRTASIEVATFIDAQCIRGADIEEPTPAKEIYAAYVAFGQARGWPVLLTNAAFGQEIAALGVEKIKTRAGMAYIGLGLPAVPRPIQAAE